jgi:hypothetical protein
MMFTVSVVRVASVGAGRVGWSAEANQHDGAIKDHGVGNRGNPLCWRTGRYVFGSGEC